MQPWAETFFNGCFIAPTRELPAIPSRRKNVANNGGLSVLYPSMLRVLVKGKRFVAVQQTRCNVATWCCNLRRTANPADPFARWLLRPPKLFARNLVLFHFAPQGCPADAKAFGGAAKVAAGFAAGPQNRFALGNGVAVVKARGRGTNRGAGHGCWHVIHR